MNTFIWYGKSPTGADVEFRVDLPFDTIEGDAWAVDAALKKAGFVPSQRFAPPTFGGGRGNQQRAQNPPPPGIVVPEHCGVAMKYVKYKKDGTVAAPAMLARGLVDGWKDMWLCSKDKQCEDVTSGKSDRPAVNFDMKVMAGDAAPGSVNDASAKPMGLGDFLNAALKLGYTRLQILEFEHTNEDELKKYTPDAWADLLERLSAAKTPA